MGVELGGLELVELDDVAGRDLERPGGEHDGDLLDAAGVAVLHEVTSWGQIRARTPMPVVTTAA
jgi:hypothetical protein